MTGSCKGPIGHSGEDRETITAKNFSIDAIGPNVFPIFLSVPRKKQKSERKIFISVQLMFNVLTTVFVYTRLWKTKHPRKRFQNFRQPLVWPSDLLYVMIAGCDWWISIRSVDNMYDQRKRFRYCFIFESRISRKTVVKAWGAAYSMLIHSAMNLSMLFSACGSPVQGYTIL